METVEKNTQNLMKCLCKKCPSYTFLCKIQATPNIVHSLVSGLESTDHMESMFCAFGPSKCLEEKKGCLCGECGVFREHKLSQYYYCVSEN